MRKRGRKPRIIVVSCPFFCYFIVQVQNVSSPLHNLICGLVHISDKYTPTSPDDFAVIQKLRQIGMEFGVIV